MNKETVTNWFEIITAGEALQQIELMRQPAASKENFRSFVLAFRDAKFQRFKKNKPEFTAPWNDLIGKLYFIAAPFCFTWVRFDDQAPAALQGRWFYFNLSMGIKPNANARVKSAMNGNDRRVIFIAYANSSNEDLLNMTDEERGQRMPTFEQSPDDLVIVTTDNPIAQEPVHGAPYSAFEIIDKTAHEAMVPMEKMQVLFPDYSSLLARIEKVMYLTEMWGTEQKWQISTIREQILWGQGVRPTQQYITLTRDTSPL